MTPLQDGMNLVAKEYVAAQNPFDPGVLVLSEFAGAAKQLDAALLVNPARHRRHGAADRQRRSTMGLDERRERWHAMVAKLRSSSVQGWFADFLRALNETRRAPARLAASRAAAAPVVLDLAGRSAQRH